jgi:hypothetical protein
MYIYIYMYRYIYMYVCMLYIHIVAMRYLRRRASCWNACRSYVSIREHTWAYVSIREHTWAYDLRRRASCWNACRSYVSIREHTWAYVSIREHTWAYDLRRRASCWNACRSCSTLASICLRCCCPDRAFSRYSSPSIVSWLSFALAPVSIRQRKHMAAYVSIRQHTSAYVLEILLPLHSLLAQLRPGTCD